MIRHRFLAVAALLGALAASSAFAQSMSFAVPGATNMRAGPGTEYPVIARILGGSVVNIFGCLSSYGWCDVSVEGTRGWVSGRRLEFAYAGARVPVPSYAVRLQVPVIGFDYGYWDRHYSDRDFYRDRRGDCDRPRDDGGIVAGRVLGEVTDRPGYCYVLDRYGNSVVARCP